MAGFLFVACTETPGKNLLANHWQNKKGAPDLRLNPSRLESAMQKRFALPPSPRARRILRATGKAPTTWTKLAYTRAYTLQYGMRAAKLTAVIDCIKAIRREERLPLP